MRPLSAPIGRCIHPTILSLALAWMAWGPAPRPSPAQDGRATIRAEVALVNLVFTATDRKGQVVEGLGPEDFELFEDGKTQKIEYFSDPGKGSDIPLTIALLVDTSGSVRQRLEYEKEAAARFFREILRPDRDLALVIQFDSEVNLVQDFTQDPEALYRALDSLRAGNNTALYDAVYLAAEEKLKAEAGRKVVVVITDGADTSSIVKKETAIEAAQKNDILIYGIGVQSDRFRTDFGVLQKFARETGGEFFSPKASVEEIRDAFRSIQRDIRGHYSLGYTPSNRLRDGAFRKVELRSKRPGVRVRTRSGYYAPRPSPSR
ncbi:MAG: VWA domain-containing protein [Acidobacteria bacterium]|nr:VWA domain-containing protein [Acidobacteriota bacterium]